MGLINNDTTLLDTIYESEHSLSTCIRTSARLDLPVHPSRRRHVNILQRNTTILKLRSSLPAAELRAIPNGIATENCCNLSIVCLQLALHRTTKHQLPAMTSLMITSVGPPTSRALALSRTRRRLSFWLCSRAKQYIRCRKSRRYYAG